MRVAVHPLARRDWEEALAFYDGIDACLARELNGEIARAVEWIQEYPGTPRIEYKNIRSVRVRRFPYRIYYRFSFGDTLTILALEHASRDPRNARRKLHER